MEFQGWRCVHQLSEVREVRISEVCEHTAIIFDDCAEPEVYITNHKMFFQASEVITVDTTSRTNCFALEVDTGKKMIIVCADHPPCTGWPIQSV